MKKKIVVAVSGATGAVLALKMLEHLNRLDVETHLVISRWAQETIKIETKVNLDTVLNSAGFFYENDNVGADIASGSFHHDGMVIIPCSMKTLAAISCGYSNELISRAADVTLKEQSKLILAVRETPLNQIHLENMLKLARMGATIFPFMPSFYNHPKSLEEAIDQYIGRVISHLGIENNIYKVWRNNE